MTLSEKQQIFTYNIAQLIDFAFSKQIGLTFGEVYRTVEQQKIYFDSGRSKTMNSRHIDRLAVDFNFFIGGKMLFTDSSKYIEDAMKIKPLGDFWVSLNTSNVWGGDWDRDHEVIDETFRDPYHFEAKPV